MKHNTSWFTILEILVAMIIMTIWIFWIYKMIGSNMVLLSTYEDKKEINSLFSPFENCLFALGYENFSGSEYHVWDTFSLHFWEKNIWCFIGDFDENFTFSGIHMSEKKYFLTAKIEEKNEEKIILHLNIFSEIYGFANDEGKNIEITKK